MNTHHPSLVSNPAPAPLALVVMGVAGCGKSTLARLLAAQLGLAFVEGDDFHPPSNVAKMSRGLALDDDDRRGWLESLAVQLRGHAGGAVLSCSALKQAYRDRLRAGCAGLRFVHLRIDPALANTRVAARFDQHFFQPSLVASQFAALEDPVAEPDVLQLDATLAPDALCRAVTSWLRRPTPSPNIATELDAR